MMTVSYGTRYDARIADGIRAGRTIGELVRALGPSAFFIGRRGHELGLGDLIHKNGLKARSRKHVGMRRVTTHRTAGAWRKFVADYCAANGDRLVSDVARSLRNRPAELSDAAIAALHERGLTVDELCAGTCRSPWAVIRAVRQAARCV